jgi:hypothetical protein
MSVVSRTMIRPVSVEDTTGAREAGSNFRLAAFL